MTATLIQFELSKRLRDKIDLINEWMLVIASIRRETRIAVFLL